VVLGDKFGIPQVINDGVSIARAISLPDPAENAGAQLIKEVAGKTNDSAGDGTTTACVLARELIMCVRRRSLAARCASRCTGSGVLSVSLFPPTLTRARALLRYGLQSVTAGANPVGIKKGIDKTCTFLVQKLEENAKPIRGTEDIRAVATISSGNDEEIGKMIAGAIEKARATQQRRSGRARGRVAALPGGATQPPGAQQRLQSPPRPADRPARVSGRILTRMRPCGYQVGPDGVLSIESGTGLETTVEVEEGMEIDRGYISSQFVTNLERSTVEMDNCRVLITDHKIEKVAELIPILEQITKANVPLMIIAEDVTAEALATLVVNKLRQVLSVVAIKAPGFGERRKSLLQDIAIVTGAEFIAKDLGMTVDGATLDQLGYIRKLTVRKDECTLIADAASAADVKARVSSLKKELQEASSTYDQEKLSERIAKLSGGVAVIKVGAATEAELEDRKLRIEDAKNATFAAVEEGVVPGGGAALVHLAAMITDFKKTLKDEELLGAEIVQKAITAPARLIASNAGVEGEVVVQRVAKSEWAFGYNAMTDTYENLLEAGVLDPKKVTRSGLQNACSVAGMVLTTQAVISERPKQAAAAPKAGGGLQPGPGMMSL